MTSYIDITSLAHLNADRYAKAQDLAKEKILKRDPKPDARLYMAKTGDSKYPDWLRNVIVGAIFAVMAITFYISAGKFIVASDAVQKATTGDSIRLSETYHDWALALGLVMGELGAVVCMVAKVVIESKEVSVGRFKFNAVSTALSIFAGMCAAIAISANVSVSALHLAGWQDQWVFGWLITIIPPLSVLGFAWILEKVALGWLSEREGKLRAYRGAVAVWDKRHADIERHPDYMATLAYFILDQAIKVSRRNKELIEEAVANDPSIRWDIIRGEIQRHDWALVSGDSVQWTVGGQPARPGEVSADPALPANVSTVKDRVAALWNDDPSTREMSARTLADRIGVSKSAVAEAINTLKMVENADAEGVSA